VEFRRVRHDVVRSGGPLPYRPPLVSRADVFFFGLIVLALAARPILHAILVRGFLLLLLLDILQWSFVIGSG